MTCSIFIASSSSSGALASTSSRSLTCTMRTRPGIGARMLPLECGARIASATGFLSLKRRVMPSLEDGQRTLREVTGGRERLAVHGSGERAVVAERRDDRFLPVENRISPPPEGR